MHVNRIAAVSSSMRHHPDESHAPYVLCMNSIFYYFSECVFILCLGSCTLRLALARPNHLLIRWNVNIDGDTEFISHFSCALVYVRWCIFTWLNVFKVTVYEKWIGEKMHLRLTRENRLQHDTCIAFALDDYVFDVPFVGLSLDYDRTVTIQMSADPIDEWSVNSSNCILSPKWIRPCCDDSDHMDAPANVIWENCFLLLSSDSI